MNLFAAAFAAWHHVFSPPMRRILWRSLGLTLGLLFLVWLLVSRLFARALQGSSFEANYPFLEGFAFFFAGIGLLIALAYILPTISVVVAGFFFDEAAGIIERSDFPNDPPGRDLPLGVSIGAGFRFAALSLGVNLAALLLFFVPGVNALAFFAANAYLMGREYFELAAARFMTLTEAARLRRDHRGLVLLAGTLIAMLLAIPVLNLLTPLFGIALMVHVRKGVRAG